MKKETVEKSIDDVTNDMRLKTAEVRDDIAELITKTEAMLDLLDQSFMRGRIDNKNRGHVGFTRPIIYERVFKKR
jgi:hypothetical protein